MEPEIVHDKITPPDPKIRRTIRYINTDIPQDDFTIQVIQEHDAEGHLYKWLIGTILITLFTAAV